ncbi:hypothetical protein OZL92_16765 [Bacillus sonorensis]|uniref:Uncharacterized protein n=3 Tax=Bacillus TaxID=1386 RepID=A0A0T6BQ91_9BACI|nr:MULTISPECIES: hypothetical protein [Bacillus]ASB89381.1 SPBc2 prophage-derived uncharacterized protein YomY [Bacillus sonorensis]EME72499.1 protein YomY [Bacillus sonorensis L12]KRT93779.1 hypothetical protein AB447_216860 [Bacillus glycinifermentans]MCZ0075276.1 hypothetical protein [Bacillus sonorensis]MCZ0092996.1 hypothetical protein [Bacillus sonorensis]
MSNKSVFQPFDEGQAPFSLQEHCVRLSKKNNSVLYKVEQHLNKKMLADAELAEIREIILDVSAEIVRLGQYLSGDLNEGL